MKIEFWMTGDLGVYIPEVEEPIRYRSLAEAIDFIQENWIEGDGQTADVVDLTTGEILVHFEDSYDEPEEEEIDDCDFEMGYNAYMGCFDWDC